MDTEKAPKAILRNRIEYKEVAADAPAKSKGRTVTHVIDGEFATDDDVREAFWRDPTWPTKTTSGVTIISVTRNFK